MGHINVTHTVTQFLRSSELQLTENQLLPAELGWSIASKESCVSSVCPTEQCFEDVLIVDAIILH